eukprot:tig00020660_g12534.t1
MDRSQPPEAPPHHNCNRAGSDRYLEQASAAPTFRCFSGLLHCLPFFSEPPPYIEQASALLDLPDPLLLCIVQIACTCAAEVAIGGAAGTAPAPAAAPMAAELDRESTSEANRELDPPVDLRRLCRLRGVCRRLAALLAAGDAAPRARLAVALSARPADAKAAMERACRGAARVGGIEELDLELSFQGDLFPLLSLAPLAWFRSLRALRVGASCPGMYSVQGYKQLSPLAALPLLTSLDLAGRPGSRAFFVGPDALAALTPLPLVALRATVVSDASAGAEIVSSVSKRFPRLRRLQLHLHPPREKSPRTLAREREELDELHRNLIVLNLGLMFVMMSHS